MWQFYPYSTISVDNIVVILHINGAGAIFLLIFDHQDTESESREMEICVAGPF